MTMPKFTTIRHFNSHAHVERDTRIENGGDNNGYFNSHAHVERDIAENTAEIGRVISTHTLTWSVTGRLWAG